MGRVAVGRSRAGWALLAVALAAVALDQASKAAVRAFIFPLESIPLIPGVLYLTHVRNDGAAFGMMPGRRWLFIATSIAVIIGIAIYWFRSRPGGLTALALGLVAGGALGNLYDRAVVGQVTDFLDMRLIPVFNVADSAIVVGVGLLLWQLLFLEDDGSDGADAEPPAVEDARP